MNLQLWKFISVVLVSLAPLCNARQHAVKTKADDAGYVVALATANRFLNAWQTGDLETGMLLLSNHARRTQSAESVENFFSRNSNRAFEISHGKCDRNACRFPVVMLNEEKSRTHRKFSEIVLVNDGTAEWVVDNVP